MEAMVGGGTTILWSVAGVVLAGRRDKAVYHHVAVTAVAATVIRKCWRRDNMIGIPI